MAKRRGLWIPGFDYLSLAIEAASDETSGFAATASGWLDRIALTGFAAMLLLGAALPVYTDEIAWRFQERAGFAPGLDTMMSDTCGANSLARPPLFMMPVRLFSAAANTWLDAPVFVRYEGVACALLWLALLWGLASLASSTGQTALRDRPLPLRVLILAPLGMGILPLLMVMSRPEQSLILGTLAAIILTLRHRQREAAHDRRAIWPVVVALILLSAICLSYHLKGVLYVAVFVICLMFCSRDRATLAARSAGIAAVVLLAWTAFGYWSHRFHCPDDPVLAAKLASENIAALLAAGQGMTSAIGAAAQGALPFVYILQAAPDLEPMSFWLPGNLVSWQTSYIFMAAQMAVWLSLVSASIWNLTGFVKERKGAALLEPKVPLALCLFAIILIWGASQLNKNVYESAHILPTLAVACLLCLTLPRDNPLLRKLGSKAKWAFVAAGLVSQLVILATHGPTLWQRSQATTYFADQPYSVPISGYDGRKADIAAAMRLAGMPRDRPLRAPLVDDLTYLALQDSVLPIHRLGVLSDWNGSIADPAAYLLSRQSDGVVMGCAYLPAAMTAAASRVGDICAISAAGLASIRGIVR